MNDTDTHTSIIKRVRNAKAEATRYYLVDKNNVSLVYGIYARRCHALEAMVAKGLKFAKVIAV